jgi:calcium-dependent protein kinase
MSPDVIKGSYGKESDVWSIGVIMFVMLSQSYPFSGPNEKEIFRRIREAAINLKRGVWLRISDSAKDLVSRLLTKSADRRITLD